MEVIVKIEKNTFVSDNGEPIDYHNIIYECYDGEVLKIKLPADKAKIIKQDVMLRKGTK